MKINSDQPAFPTDCSTDTSYTEIRGGLTKREWFAGLALQAIIASPDYQSDEKSLCKMACTYADALLAELAKEIPK